MNDFFDEYLTKKDKKRIFKNHGETIYLNEAKPSKGKKKAKGKIKN